MSKATPPPQGSQGDDLADVPAFASLVAAESAAFYASNSGAEEVKAPPPKVPKVKRAAPKTENDKDKDKDEKAAVTPGNRADASVKIAAPDDDDEGVDDEEMRGEMDQSTNNNPRLALQQITEGMMKEAVSYTRHAKRKVSRVLGKAEDLCKDYLDRHLDNVKNIEVTMRTAADEIIMTCIKHGRETSAQSETTPFHQRFLQLQDDYRHMLQFELSGHHERTNFIRTNSELIEGEMYRRAVNICTKHLNEGAEGLPKGVIAVSPKTLADVPSGLVITALESNHAAAKHLVKSLSRFVNLLHCPFSIPLMMTIEVYGLSFVVSTMPALSIVVRNPLEQPDTKFGIEAAVCELQFDIDDRAAVADTRFAYGCDGRIYCMYAFGLIPLKYPTSFLNLLDPTKSIDPAVLDAQLAARMDHAAVEAVAMSRSGGGQVTKALHRNGLRAGQLGHLHGYLSRQESLRLQTVGAPPDPNLAGALTSCVAELLGRTLKCVLRALWADAIATDKDLSAEDKPREMAVYAHQLINLLIVDNHPSRTRPEHQLYLEIIKQSQKLCPPDPKIKKEMLKLDEHLVSEMLVANRVANMTGLRFVEGVICGVMPGRLVRATRLVPRDLWFEVHRGRHQEVMKRIVSQIKYVRGTNPDRSFHLTCHLADVFHQAQGRSGVSRRPADLFDKAAWLRTSERSMDGSGTAEEDDADDHDDPYKIRRELTILRIIAAQATATCEKAITEAEAAQRERLALQQESQAATTANPAEGGQPAGSKTPNGGITPLDFALPSHQNSARSMNPPPGDRSVEEHSMSSLMIPKLSSGALSAPDGPSGRNSARSGRNSARMQRAKVPAAAQMQHADAVNAIVEYVRRSIELFREAGADKKFEKLDRDAVSARRRHLRGLTETVYRAQLMSVAASVVRDRQLSDFVEITLKSLDRFRRVGILDARGGSVLWNTLFDARSNSLMRVDPDAAIETGREKLEHTTAIFGSASIQVAAAHSDLGAVMLSLGRNVDGRLELEAGFRHMTEVAPLCSGTFTSANNLGFTYFRIAERSMDPSKRRRRHGFLRMALPQSVLQLLDEAEAAFNFVIANRQHASVITVADALNNSGSVHTFRGRYSVAMPRFEESLSLTRGMFSDEHPDRASAIRNMRTCERRMRANAALWISCFFKRFRARRQLSLLQRGAVHVELFQRLGRGFADRLRLYQLAEYRSIRNIGRGGFVDDGGAAYMGDDDEEDAYGAPMSDPSPTSAASPILPVPGVAALPVPPAPGQAPAEEKKDDKTDLPGAIDDASPEKDAAAKDAVATPSLTLTASELEALSLIQGAGRGCLTRAMIRKIFLFRQKKKKKAKK